MKRRTDNNITSVQTPEDKSTCFQRGSLPEEVSRYKMLLSYLFLFVTDSYVLYNVATYLVS